jgi:hypothetical protein
MPPHWDSPGPVVGDYPSSTGGVYKSEDGGDTCSRKNCGLVNSRVTSVAVLSGDTSVVVIGVEGGTVSFSQLQGEFFAGGLYRSIDQSIKPKPGSAQLPRSMTRQTVTSVSTRGWVHS